MNKKGGGWALTTTGKAIIVVILLLLFIYFIYTNISPSFGAIKTYSSEKIKDLLEAGEIGLDDIPEVKQQELAKEQPDVLAKLKLKKYEDEFEKALASSLYNEAEKEIENYVKVCEDPKFKEHCSLNDKEKVDDMRKKLEEKKKLISATKEFSNIEQIEDVNERIKAFEEYVSKYSDSKEKSIMASVTEAKGILSVLKKEIKEEEKPVGYYNFVSRLEEIKGRIKSGLGDKIYDILIDELKDLKYDISASDFYEKTYNLRGEIDYWIVICYGYKKFDEDRCEKLYEYFVNLIEVYDRAKFVTRGIFNRPIIKPILFDSPFNCAKETKNYEMMISSFEDYRTIYGTKGYDGLRERYLDPLFSTAMTDCSISSSSANCHSSIKKINFEDRSVKLSIPRWLIQDYKKLGCYYDYDWNDECLNCYDESIIHCSQYNTEDWWEAGRDLWRHTCLTDPCVVKDGPCGYDDGSGLDNLASCCPHGQTYC